MGLNLITKTGKKSTKSIELADDAFAKEFNESLVHQVVTAYMAAGRAGTRAHKNRAAVSGGGAKPFRQKGTGRARAGTIRSPLWRTGGKTFAAAPQDHSQKVNKKMYRGAMQCIVSELIRQDRLIIVDSLSLDAPKTKELNEKLKALGVENALLVTEAEDASLTLAARNLVAVETVQARQIDPVSLVRFEKVVMTTGAIAQVAEMLA